MTEAHQQNAPVILLSRRVQHVINKNPIPSRRVIDQNVCNRADQLPILNDRAAAHGRLALWTTVFRLKTAIHRECIAATYHIKV